RSAASNVDGSSNVASYADPAGPGMAVPPGTTTEQQAAALAAARAELEAHARAQQGMGGYSQQSYDNMLLAGMLPNPQLDIPGEVIKQVAPATTEQIRQIIEEIHLRQGAASTPVNPGIVNQASQYVVDLSPGATPPVVRVAKGVGAIVNFVDSAGNPWPISFARNFHQEAATVTQMATHVLS